MERHEASSSHRGAGEEGGTPGAGSGGGGDAGARGWLASAVEDQSLGSGILEAAMGVFFGVLGVVVFRDGDVWGGLLVLAVSVALTAFGLAAV